MQFAHPRNALAQRCFGRGPVWNIAAPPDPFALTLSQDLKLFTTTFAAGFLFVSLLIA